MSIATPSACSEARLAIGARRDGVAHDGASLARHLATCGECAAFERELARLATGWGEITAAAAPPPELWARIEAQLGPAPSMRARRPRLALRAAAALLGFFAAYQATPGAEPARRNRAHLVARWLNLAPEEPTTLLEGSPEYRLLLTRLQQR